MRIEAQQQPNEPVAGIEDNEAVADEPVATTEDVAEQPIVDTEQKKSEGHE